MIRRSAAETNGELLLWELFLAVGGRVPSSHAHPEQEEKFTVLEGRMRFRVGRRTVTLGPDDTVTVPPGAVHSFANAGVTTAQVLVETRPALEMERLLVTAAEMARETRRTARVFPSLPRPHELFLFMRDFEHEVRAPYVPAILVRSVVRPVAALSRRAGLDGRYRRWRNAGC